MCGNGSGRTEHPSETFGEDWYQWGGLDENKNTHSNPTCTQKEHVGK